MLHIYNISTTYYIYIYIYIPAQLDVSECDAAGRATQAAPNARLRRTCRFCACRACRGQLATSREIEHVRRCLRRRGSCTSTEVARLMPSRSRSATRRDEKPWPSTQVCWLICVYLSIYIYIYICIYGRCPIPPPDF